MAEAVGSRVEWLVRVGFGPFELGELEPGAWRSATQNELAALRRIGIPVPVDLEDDTGLE